MLELLEVHIMLLAGCGVALNKRLSVGVHTYCRYLEIPIKILVVWVTKPSKA